MERETAPRRGLENIGRMMNLKEEGREAAAAARRAPSKTEKKYLLIISRRAFFPSSSEPVPDLATDQALDDGDAAPAAERSVVIVVVALAVRSSASSCFPLPVRPSTSSAPRCDVEASVRHCRRRCQPQQPPRGLPPRPHAHANTAPTGPTTSSSPRSSPLPWPRSARLRSSNRSAGSTRGRRRR